VRWRRRQRQRKKKKFAEAEEEEQDLQSNATHKINHSPLLNGFVSAILMVHAPRPYLLQQTDSCWQWEAECQRQQIQSVHWK